MKMRTLLLYSIKMLIKNSVVTIMYLYSIEDDVYVSNDPWVCPYNIPVFA